MVTFSLVNSFTHTLTLQFATAELVVITIFGAVVFWPTGNQGVVQLALQQVAALTLSQTIISSIKPSDNISFWDTLEFIFKAFFILGMFGAMPNVIKQNPNGSQLMGLVLFMLAEATRFVTIDQQIAHVIPPIGIAVVILLHYVKFNNPVYEYVAEGISLFCINSVITALFGIAPDDYYQLFWLVSITILVSHLRDVDADLQSVSDFTTWKSARIISNFLVEYHNDTSLLISLVAFTVSFKTHGLNALSILLVTNSILSYVSEGISNVSGNDRLLALFALVVLLKIFLDLFRSR